MGPFPVAGHMSGTSGIIIFYEMKGDVRMSRHEKEREQEDAYTKTESHSYPIRFFQDHKTLFVGILEGDVFLPYSIYIHNKQSNIFQHRCA